MIVGGLWIPKPIVGKRKNKPKLNISDINTINIFVKTISVILDKYFVYTHNNAYNSVYFNCMPIPMCF